jgi:hypothetical protein
MSSDTEGDRVTTIVKAEESYISLKALPVNPRGKEVPHFFIARGNASGEVLSVHIDEYTDEHYHVTTRRLVHPSPKDAGVATISPEGAYIPTQEGKRLFAAPLPGALQPHVSLRNTSGSVHISSNVSGSIAWAFL